MIFRKTGQVAFDLIIFDCDGVLVDSEVVSCRARPCENVFYSSKTARGRA
jgi:phosphoglycolate phosphatase-like HAD superfamily hydrolase